MKQLTSVNLKASGTVGMCLAYAQNVMSVEHHYPSAIENYRATQFKHNDREFPADVCVPIWFTYRDAGHVAINVPGKGIYSSPWELGTDHAVLSSIEELEDIYSNSGQYPLVYLGWTEDIGVQRVVINERDDMVDDTIATLAWVEALDLPTTDPGYKEFSRYWVGKKVADMLQWLVDSPRHKDIVTKARNYKNPSVTVGGQEYVPK